jgi:hypothetical protein
MIRSPVRLAWALVLIALGAASACTTSDAPIGSDCARGFCKDNETFGPSTVDGGDAAPLPESTPMCPVTTCTYPWATCPSSEFPCETNLLKDDDNCGGCGIRCGNEFAGAQSKWSCVGGQCAFSCNVPGFRNCDGDTGNGCEVYTREDPENCGECGTKCPEGSVCSEGACVDPCQQGNWPDFCDWQCTNLTTDDFNCGTCGTVCDPTGPNEPELHPSMYYGCQQGTCGHPKCINPQQSNCNNDLSDGCEVDLHTAEHCTSCNDACPAGKVCGYDRQWRCLCDDGETYCGGWDQCRRLDDDPLNCGGCSHSCPGVKWPHFERTCSFGICGGHCTEPYADCDGISDNGCEVNTRVDNRNCGACGNACLTDQVCSEGKCLVAPCGPGGLPAK